MRSATAYSTKFGSSMSDSSASILWALPAGPALKSFKPSPRPRSSSAVATPSCQLTKTDICLHRPVALCLAQRRAGLSQAAQERRRRPAVAVALMPGGDLVVDLAHTDRVGPVHQPAAIAREAEPVQPHHIDVAGPQRLALVKDFAGLVDAGE